LESLPDSLQSTSWYFKTLLHCQRAEQTVDVIWGRVKGNTVAPCILVERGRREVALVKGAGRGRAMHTYIQLAR